MALAPTLSALVVAHNEEAQLAECLECLGFADEILVVLDKDYSYLRQCHIRRVESVKLIQQSLPLKVVGGEGIEREEGQMIGRERSEFTLRIIINYSI